MGAEAELTARTVLRNIQTAIDARDIEALTRLFDGPAVLIGTGGDARNENDRGQGVIGFAAFGDIVVTDDSGERRAPIRLTALAVEDGDGWRLRQFHGSIPSSF